MFSTQSPRSSICGAFCDAVHADEMNTFPSVLPARLPPEMQQIHFLDTGLLEDGISDFETHMRVFSLHNVVQA